MQAPNGHSPQWTKPRMDKASFTSNSAFPSVIVSQLLFRNSLELLFRNLLGTLPGTFESARLLSKLSAHGLDEGDLIDLFQCGHPEPDFIERRLAQKAHTLVACSAANLRGRPPRQNHFSDRVAQIQQFVNCGSSSEASACALNASRALVEWNLRPLRRVEAAGFEHIRGI